MLHFYRSLDWSFVLSRRVRVCCVLLSFVNERPSSTHSPTQKLFVVSPCPAAADRLLVRLLVCSLLRWPAGWLAGWLVSSLVECLRDGSRLSSSLLLAAYFTSHTSDPHNNASLFGGVLGHRVHFVCMLAFHVQSQKAVFHMPSGQMD